MKKSCLYAILLTILLLASACGSEKQIVLPYEISLGTNSLGDEMQAATLSELAEYSQCAVRCSVVSSEEFYDNTSYRYLCAVEEDYYGNLNYKGVGENNIYVYGMGDVLQAGKAYDLLLYAEEFAAYPHIAYFLVSNSAIIQIEDAQAYLQTVQGAVELAAASDIVKCLRASAANAGKIALLPQIASVADAASNATDIWLITLLETDVGQSNEYLNRCDFHIDQVLKGAYDASTAEQAQYRYALPAACDLEEGSQYLLFLEDTEVGYRLQSQEYCLVKETAAGFYAVVSEYAGE